VYTAVVHTRVLSTKFSTHGRARIFYPDTTKFSTSPTMDAMKHGSTKFSTRSILKKKLTNSYYCVLEYIKLGTLPALLLGGIIENQNLDFNMT
jgi:hypothetical protein